MHVFNQETLITIFEEQQGVDISSYGKPRDGFVLSIDVPNWVSGFGGRYEMHHTNVPAGVYIAVGDLADLDVTDQAKLKAQLGKIDIYPTGTSGDFTGADVNVLRQWFTDRSVLDNEANNQTAIEHAKSLTKEGLGATRYNDVVNYLADTWNLFANPDAGRASTQTERTKKVEIVTALLDGLSRTVRYTRIDQEKTKAYQVVGQMVIEKGNDSAIALNMTEAHKILLVREHKNGLKDMTPLDRAMLGKTHVTADGQPLGTRGQVELSHIVQRAWEIENAGQPAVPLPFLRAAKVLAV